MFTLLSSSASAVAGAVAAREYVFDQYSKWLDFCIKNRTDKDLRTKFLQKYPDAQPFINQIEQLLINNAPPKTIQTPSNTNQQHTLPTSSTLPGSKAGPSADIELKINKINALAIQYNIAELQNDNFNKNNYAEKWENLTKFKDFWHAKIFPLMISRHATAVKKNDINMANLTNMKHNIIDYLNFILNCFDIILINS